jgi:hypothetical protein
MQGKQAKIVSPTQERVVYPEYVRDVCNFSLLD